MLARWQFMLSTYLLCRKKCPSIHAEYLKGNFLIQKSKHKLSALAHGQVHEQLNAITKGDASIIRVLMDYM